MIEFQKDIKNTFDEVQRLEMERIKLGKMEELDKVGSLAQQEMAKMKAGQESTFMGNASTMGASTMQQAM